jgi:hypothetical protein
MSCWRTTTRPRSTRRPSCSGDGAWWPWWQSVVGGSQLLVAASCACMSQCLKMKFRFAQQPPATVRASHCGGSSHT